VGKCAKSLGQTILELQRGVGTTLAPSPGFMGSGREENEKGRRGSNQMKVAGSDPWLKRSRELKPRLSYGLQTKTESPLGEEGKRKASTPKKPAKATPNGSQCGGGGKNPSSSPGSKGGCKTYAGGHDEKFWGIGLEKKKITGWEVFAF